uniref:Uncharacterized protein n=1 Tax=Arundo donax TaxID=35708 RepID=A0A0A9AIF4_ARUDO
MSVPNARLQSHTQILKTYLYLESIISTTTYSDMYEHFWCDHKME